MSVLKELEKRSGEKCELCSANESLNAFEVLPFQRNGKVDDYAHICSVCSSQISGESEIDVNHWRCLNDSMWSEVPSIQVLAYRMLHRLKSEGWPQDLLDMLYLDDETLAWAQASGDHLDKEAEEFHKDCNGVRIEAGDSVVLIKDLNVKGGGFTAKRGTAVRNVSLSHDNVNHIEGKVNGQTIVIITEYVKKS